MMAEVSLGKVSLNILVHDVTNLMHIIYIYLFIYNTYIYIYIYICVFKTKITQFYRFIKRFALQISLTIFLQDMLKCNMSFQKSLELSNKKYLQKAGNKYYLLLNCLEIISIKEQNMYSATQLKHSLLINSFNLITLDKVFVICPSRSPHVFPDRLDHKNL